MKRSKMETTTTTNEGEGRIKYEEKVKLEDQANEFEGQTKKGNKTTKYDLNGVHLICA